MSYSNTISKTVAPAVTLESGISDRSWDVYRDAHRLGSIFLGLDSLWYNSGNRIGYADRESAIASVLSNPKPACEPTIVNNVVVPF